MKDFVCPFSNQKIDYKKITYSSNKDSTYNYYPINISNKDIYIKLCSELFEMFEHNEVDLKQLEIVRPILLKKLINNQLNDIIHWDCEGKDKPGNLILKKIIEESSSNPALSINRGKKIDSILFYIKENQKQDGGNVRVDNNPAIWGNLYFKNFEELVFYIEELNEKGVIFYDKTEMNVRFTLKGLDYMEESSTGKIERDSSQEYDIGLSFAGEERIHVESVAKELTQLGVKIFYDNNEQSSLWGKDLYQHLNDIYKNKCKYCIVFISKNYAEKLWTKHELKAAQTRAFTENQEYILPIKFDETEIPGINITTGYLNFFDFTPKQIAEMAIQKLRK